MIKQGISCVLSLCPPPSDNLPVIVHFEPNAPSVAEITTFYDNNKPLQGILVIV
jgi:hypothetical protein